MDRLACNIPFAQLISFARLLVCMLPARRPCHPTRSGVNALREVIFHAVPILCMPLSADQPDNAALAKHLGVGSFVPMGVLLLAGWWGWAARGAPPPRTPDG